MAKNAKMLYTFWATGIQETIFGIQFGLTDNKLQENEIALNE